MATSLSLDFEEWLSLFVAASKVPEEDRRPCLATALLGVASALRQFNLAHPDETTEALASGQHDCGVAECQKALDAVTKAFGEGHDPFGVVVDVEEVAEGPGVITEILDRLGQLEAEVFGAKP
jgi:hypothetical protein